MSRSRSRSWVLPDPICYIILSYTSFEIQRLKNKWSWVSIRHLELLISSSLIVLLHSDKNNLEELHSHFHFRFVYYFHIIRMLTFMYPVRKMMFVRNQREKWRACCLGETLSRQDFASFRIFVKKKDQNNHTKI